MTVTASRDSSPSGDAMLPVPYLVVNRTVETRDSATLRLRPVEGDIPRAAPGQFMMLYAFGVGEVAISLSGMPVMAHRTLEHTIRDVGAVSKALHDARPGELIGVRGPFGTGWDLESAAGRDVVIVAGGVGLAPLRPVVLAAIQDRSRYRRVVVISGARSPQEFLYRKEHDDWAGSGGFELFQTIDVGAPDWLGEVGFVTEPLRRLTLDPANTTAFLCGPEPMMRFCALSLMDSGVPPHDIRVSLERNMKCGVGLCGHCQLGEMLLCRDGPVTTYERAEGLLAVREM